MSVIPELPSPFLTAFATGFLFGLTVCVGSCLPYLAGYIASVGAGFKKSLQITLIFNSGRVAAYALIGAFVASISGLVGYLTNESLSATSNFAVYSTVFFGIVTIIIGAHLLIKNRKGVPTCSIDKNLAETPKPQGVLGKFDFKAFTLGLTRGLIICTPLIALLAWSATFATPIDSFLFAVLFGVGTAISPIIILSGGLTGWLLNKAPLFRRAISIAGALVLIVLGAGTIINTLMVIK